MAYTLAQIEALATGELVITANGLLESAVVDRSYLESGSYERTLVRGVWPLKLNAKQHNRFYNAAQQGWIGWVPGTDDKTIALYLMYCEAVQQPFIGMTVSHVTEKPTRHFSLDMAPAGRELTPLGLQAVRSLILAASEPDKKPHPVFTPLRCFSSTVRSTGLPNLVVKITHCVRQPQHWQPATDRFPVQSDDEDAPSAAQPIRQLAFI